MSELDLSKLTSLKGATIIVHLEDPNDMVEIENSFSGTDDLQNRVRELISHRQDITDPGEGGIIHLMFASNGHAAIFDEKGFSEWEKDPKWPREEVDPVAELLGAILRRPEPRNMKGNKLDASNIVTKDGSPIVFEWESPDLIHKMEEEMVQPEFEECVLGVLDDQKQANSQLITGPGIKIYVVTNNDLESTFLSESQHEEWNQNRDWAKPLHVSNDLEKIATADGKQIILHFEDPAVSSYFTEHFDQPSLVKSMRDAVAKAAERDNVDLTHIGNINVLIDDEGELLTIMSDDDYAKWAENPVWKNPNSPADPTDEQVEKYQDVEAYITLKDDDPENCSICLRQDCPLRRVSFDESVLEIKITELEDSVSE